MRSHGEPGIYSRHSIFARRINRSMLAISTALIVTSLLAFYAVWRVGDLSRVAIAKYANERLLAQELRVQAGRAVAANRAYFLTGDLRLLADVAAAEATFFDRAGNLERVIETDEGKQLLSAVTALKQAHTEAVALAVNMRDDAPSFDTTLEFLESHVMPITQQLDVLLEELVELKTGRLEAAGQQTLQLANVAWWILLILALVNVVVSPLVAQVIRRALGAANAYATGLEQAVRAREDFMAIASHELRTPLAVLKLQNQMLRRRLNSGDTSVAQTEALDRFTDQIDRGVTNLGLLVDRMLDVSNLDGGRLALDKVRIDLTTLVRQVIERLEPLLAGARCDIDYRGPEPVVGHWDRERIEQVVTNLLMNVARHAPGQPARVAVRLDDGNAHLTVEDRGPGLAEVDHERIFERFERARAATDGSGMGLGLTVSREIVNAHNGRIWVESLPEQGACFHVQLPLYA
jgi:signal transduction histidine kinase